MKNQEVEKTEAALADAEKRFTQLEDEAKEAKRATQEAELAFKELPTDESFMRKAVSTQEAENALAKLEGFKVHDLATARNDFQKAQRRVQVAECAAAQKKATGLLETAESSLIAALEAYDVALEAHMASKQIHIQLDVPFEASQLSRKLRQCSEEMSQRFKFNYTTSAVSIVAGDESLKFKIYRPIVRPEGFTELLQQKSAERRAALRPEARSSGVGEDGWHDVRAATPNDAA